MQRTHSSGKVPPPPPPALASPRLASCLMAPHRTACRISSVLSPHRVAPRLATPSRLTIASPHRPPHLTSAPPPARPRSRTTRRRRRAWRRRWRRWSRRWPPWSRCGPSSAQRIVPPRLTSRPASPRVSPHLLASPHASPHPIAARPTSHHTSLPASPLPSPPRPRAGHRGQARRRRRRALGVRGLRGEGGRLRQGPAVILTPTFSFIWRIPYNVKHECDE